MGLYARDISYVYTLTHTHTLFGCRTGWSIRCGDAKMNWRSSPPPSNFMSHGLTEICAMHGVACVNDWGGSCTSGHSLGIPWCQKKMPWRMPSTMKGDIPSKLWCANDTHTYIYIYIMGYNCIAISGKKLFWHSVWHSFWRSGPGVPTAPIWRWGPAGDIDMVFGRRIRSWRYGA